MNKNSIFIFDDIHWSPGMLKAWNKITTNQEVTLCVDTFKFGIVFFNPDLAKEVIKLKV